MYGSNCEVPVFTVVAIEMAKISCHHILKDLQVPPSSTKVLRKILNLPVTTRIYLMSSCAQMKKNPPCLIHGDGIIKTEVKSGVHSAFSFSVWKEKKNSKEY